MSKMTKEQRESVIVMLESDSFKLLLERVEGVKSGLQDNLLTLNASALSDRELLGRYAELRGFMLALEYLTDISQQLKEEEEVDTLES